jgi:hypothetical protein
MLAIRERSPTGFFLLDKVTILLNNKKLKYEKKPKPNTDWLMHALGAATTR